MEYSEVLKQIILESRHAFIYGEKKERSRYLKSISSCSYLEEEKKTIPIYVDFPGLKDCNNKECEEWRLNSCQNSYFELYMTSLMFEKLKTELKEKELLKLESNLYSLFYKDGIKNFDILKKELAIGMSAVKEFYEHYIQTGELKSDLFQEVELDYVMFDMFLPNLKRVIPSFSEFIFIIDKVSDFGSVYTKVINTYVASRSNNYLSIKIGCENQDDWINYGTINGEFIEYVHDYGIVRMDEFTLNRTKKEQ